MNQAELSQLFHSPDAINNNQITDLELIVKEYPYFQSARAVYLKGLYKQDSFKYNSVLKTTACYTADRSILFDFITSKNLENQLDSDNRKTENYQIKPIATEIVSIEEPQEKAETKEENKIEASIHSLLQIATKTPIPEALRQETKLENSIEQSILSSIKKDISTLEDDNKTIEVAKKSWLEDSLDSSESSEFKSSETHSFQEWIQMSKFKPIERTEEESLEEKNTDATKKLEAKLDLIDKFIEANPKISPAKDSIPAPIYTQKNTDTSYLMTETLAKIYLEQKKYSKAIQAYEILILKYPEKSSLFADRILDIKEIQQNNNK